MADAEFALAFALVIQQMWWRAMTGCWCTSSHGLTWKSLLFLLMHQLK